MRMSFPFPPPLDSSHHSVQIHSRQKNEGICTNAQQPHTKHHPQDVEQGRSLKEDIFTPRDQRFTHFEMHPGGIQEQVVGDGNSLWRFGGAAGIDQNSQFFT